MPDWTDIPAREAMTSLAEHRVVYGAESPGGGWAEVSPLEILQEQGLLTPVFIVRFRSGRVRVAMGGDRFHLLRTPLTS